MTGADLDVMTQLCDWIDQAPAAGDGGRGRFFEVEFLGGLTGWGVTLYLAGAEAEHLRMVAPYTVTASGYAALALAGLAALAEYNRLVKLRG